MAIAQPGATDALNSPSHSTLHKIIGADLVAAVKSLIVDANGNVGIGTETFGTSAAKILALANGTPPSTSPADSVQLYAEDAIVSYGSDQVPDMTSNTAPSGVVSASAETSQAAWQAFNDDYTSNSSLWETAYTANDWIQYQFTSGKVINRYTMNADTNGARNARMPNTWIFKGSNDGSSWTNLDSQSSITWSAGETKTFTFTNVTSYTYYRWAITANNGDGSWLNIQELEMYAGTFSSELKVRDEAGNITTLSPHNFALMEKSHLLAWAFHSKNAHGEINVDMFKVIREVEKLTGKKFIHIGRK